MKDLENKNLGILWIGDIPENWKIESLGNVAKIILSNADKKSSSNEAKVSLCNYTDVYYNNHITLNIDFLEATATALEIERFQLKIDDVLITKDSENPHDIAIPSLVVETKKNLLCGYHLSILRPIEKKLAGSYLFFLLMSECVKSQFSSLATGITRYGLGYKHIKNVSICLPPLVTQKYIARFLDRKTAAINTLIAKKQRLIQLLEEKRTALINQAVTKGLNPNAPMKDSGIPWIGEIPRHWEICPLKYVSTFSGGSTPDKSNLAYWSGSIPWVTPKDMKRFWIGESIDCITELAVQETSIKIIQPPVVLVVVRGMILAHSFPVALTTSPLTINQDTKALACSDKTITEFLARQLSACRDGVLSLVQEADHGTKALRTDLFEKLPILLPSIEEQKEICSYANNQVEDFAKIITRLNSQIEKLQEYRRSLITAAITGKLDVAQDEIHEYR